MKTGPQSLRGVRVDLESFCRSKHLGIPNKTSETQGRVIRITEMSGGGKDGDGRR